MAVSASERIYLQLSALVKTKPNFCFLKSEILKTVFQWYFSRYWNLYNKRLLEQATLLLYFQQLVPAVNLYSYKFTYNREDKFLPRGRPKFSVCFSGKLWQQILSSHIHPALFFSKYQLFLAIQWTCTVCEVRQAKALIRFLSPSRHTAWDKSQFFCLSVSSRVS